MKLELQSEELLKNAIRIMNYDQLNSEDCLKLAEKIAMLDKSDIIKPYHLAEALQFGGSLQLWLKNYLIQLEAETETEEQLLKKTIKSEWVKRAEEVYNINGLGEKLYRIAQKFWEFKNDSSLMKNRKITKLIVSSI